MHKKCAPDVAHRECLLSFDVSRRAEREKPKRRARICKESRVGGVFVTDEFCLPLLHCFANVRPGGPGS